MHALRRNLVRQTTVRHSGDDWISWSPDDGVRGSHELAVAAYIAAMHPAVAILLVPVLKQAAMDSWAHGWPDCCADGCDECDDNLMAPYQRRLLAFAQALTEGENT